MNTEEKNYMQELKDTYLYCDLRQISMEETRAIITAAIKAAMASGALAEKEIPNFVTEVPADPKNGDVAVNVAMVSAKVFGMAPRNIAQIIIDNLPDLSDSMFDKVEVAGPGFINVYFSPAWFGSVVMAANICAEEYGRTKTGAGEKVNVEFVSANPTGPMHLGNARGGALGDCLAEVLAWAGYDVSREFYINDAGNQIDKFGRSLLARYLQLIDGEDAHVFPEDGYQGEDIKMHAKAFLEINKDAYNDKSQEELQNALVEYALPLNIEAMKNNLAAYRVEYDTWFRESSLYESGAVEEVVQRLGQRGYTYEKDGAIWYKTENEEEKDEVLIRANGFPTYFAADIAYHVDKFKRGFTTLIDAWGADHHGHVARMKTALDAVGEDGNKFDVVLFQMVNLIRDGAPVRMSKRTGKAITLVDLLEEVPIDSARFFFNMREPGSTIDFDLDLASAQDSDNPVYYVQYAHARVMSILRKMEEEGTDFAQVKAFGNTDKLSTEEERGLIRAIAAFPGEITKAAQSRNPSRITRYLMEVAMAFHRFYSACHIKGEEEGLLQARLALAIATKNVLKNGLKMMNITVPDKM